MFIFGCSASSQCVTFGCVSDINEQKNIGTAVGFNNMAVIFGSLTLQPLVGIILHLWWGEVNNMNQYSLLAYQSIMWIVPTVSVIGLLSSIILFKRKSFWIPKQ